MGVVGNYTVIGFDVCQLFAFLAQVVQWRYALTCNTIRFSVPLTFQIHEN